MKYSKYFGAKRHRFIKIKSILAPKGAIHLLNENIRYDKYRLHNGVYRPPCLLHTVNGRSNKKKRKEKKKLTLGRPALAAGT